MSTREIRIHVTPSDLPDRIEQLVKASGRIEGGTRRELLALASELRDHLAELDRDIASFILCAYVVQATDRFFLEACKATPTPDSIDRTMRILAASDAFKLLADRTVRAQIQRVQQRIGHYEDEPLEDAIAKAAAGVGPTLDGTHSTLSDHHELAEILRTSVIGKGGDC